MGNDIEIPTCKIPVTLTEVAATKALEAMQEESLQGYGLRIAVVGGGCSGLQYLLDFSNQTNEFDHIETQYGIDVYVDSFSAVHLMGTVLDYIEDANGAGFKFENPNMIRTCGGCSSAH